MLSYPLVLMSRTKAWATAVDAPQPETLRAPVNTLVHHRDTPDTVRISGWLDLASGPLVLSLADTHGRYYVIWLRDAWGTVFATVGARTTGTAPHSVRPARAGAAGRFPAFRPDADRRADAHGQARRLRRGHR